MYDVSDYDYDLPEHLIAQAPAGRRDESRLLVVDRSQRAFSDHRFFDLPKLLKPGDLLVVNNTRVVPARLYGKKESGGRVELLVLDHRSPDAAGERPRLCLLKTSKRPRKGSRLFFDKDLTAVVEARETDGRYRIRFEGNVPLDDYLEAHGAMPLPPYIRRDEQDPRSGMDRERYQTIFSKEKGAVAAPTAGLHFTDEIRHALSEARVRLAEITLHVGYGTFKPVRTSDIREHRLGGEEFRIEKPAADELREAKKEGRRVIAVGTTVVRALESMARGTGAMEPCRGTTDLLITPGFRFRVIDGLITNFHLPRSSLLFLVSALAGRELVMEAYGHATRSGYLFYSYGDAMLIL
jgi:S-adenosylmethionine:tRNA ribosyltransferase-isomerase